MFWTLDLNGTRYIVKPHNGGAQGGMRYLYWVGPDNDFEQKPLALSFISPPRLSATAPRKGESTLLDRSPFNPVNGKRSSPTDESDSSDSSESSESEVEKERRHTYDVTQPLTDVRSFNPSHYINAHGRDHHTDETDVFQRPSTSQDGPAKKRKLEVSSREMDQLYRVTPPISRRSDVRTEPADPDTSTPKMSVNDREERRKQRAVAQIERRVDRLFPQIFTPWGGEVEDVSRNTLQIILKVISLMHDNSPQKIAQTLNRALNGGEGRREPAGGKKPTRPYFKGLVASLQNTNAVTADVGGLETPLSSSGSNNQQPDARGLQRPDGVSAQSLRPDPRSILSDGNHHQLKRMSLPLEKQSRTTLIVRVSPSLEFLPLKLSEGLTSQTFYSKVLGAWKVPRESVAKVTVTFTWMDPNDTMRTMVMNDQVEGCFAHLIEQVDEAPSWAEAPAGKGKCLLDVNIVLKE